MIRSTFREGKYKILESFRENHTLTIMDEEKVTPIFNTN